MNYTITEHFARGQEKPIASFVELNDAHLFLAIKSSRDEDERKKVIYRLYNDCELMDQINKENISTSHAQYAEGNGDFNAKKLVYLLVTQTIDSKERAVLAKFDQKNDILLFINNKLENDRAIHDNDLFLIFKDKTLLDTVNRTIIEHRRKDSNESENNASKYTLSPLSTRPTPGGGPADFWVEKKDEEDN